jgi:glutamyl/glutaminyl-tRNA synthetase
VVFTDLVRGEVRFHTEIIGDPVIVRGDGHPAYNFAVVVDDALMEVTHVIRGEDHISNTPRQILLYEALGFTAPAFAHLSLVLGPDHSPLSKRHGATSVAEFREKGYLPEALVNYLALLGWSPRAGDNDELMAASELARRFSLDRVGHSASVFDEEKLAWVNRHYLKTIDPIRLAELAVPFFTQAGVRMTPDEQAIEFGVGDGDGELVGGPAESGAVAPRVPVRLRRETGARRRIDRGGGRYRRGARRAEGPRGRTGGQPTPRS